MFILEANKNRLRVVRREAITSGSVNVYNVSFQLSEHWDYLDRTAVFKTDSTSISVALDNTNICEIPWEVMQEALVNLQCGLYGTQGGETVLPTIWASLGTILAGTETGDSEQSKPPTPDIWQQELAKKGDALEYDGLNLSLMSGEKTLSTVQIAGGDGGTPVPGPAGPPGPPGPAGEPGEPGKDGQNGFSPTVSTSTTTQGTTVTITDVDGPHSFDVMNGQPGAEGPEGPAGKPGQDGKTPYIGENGNWWIGETDTGVSATGSSIEGSRGPDGNPIGTVISFMGTSAPDDYLVCDGAIYNVSDYPDLSDFFSEQFGSKNYFGGNGTTTFAVPDMRNLFIRGYHGESEEQLSGEIGKKQEGTIHSSLITGKNVSENSAVMWSNYNKLVYGDSDLEKIQQADTNNYLPGYSYGYIYPTTVSGQTLNIPTSYTSRPVNMAVLYCIKAKVSKVAAASSEEVYSTEETRIGTWIDGKPLYRKIVPVKTPSSDSVVPVGDTMYHVETVCFLNAIAIAKNGRWTPIPFHYSTTTITVQYDKNKKMLYMFSNQSDFRNCDAFVEICYTKTTD